MVPASSARIVLEISSLRAVTALFAIAFASWVNVAAAQSTVTPKRLGILSALACPTSDKPTFWDPLIQDMARRGWIQGRTLIIDCVATGTELERAAQLARELVARQPDVLLGQGATPVVQLKRATTTIPIVTAAPDPLRVGIVENLARPEGNVTGLAPMTFDLVVKRLELLKQVLPRLSRLAIIRSQPNNTGTKGGLEALKADVATVSQNLGFEWTIFNPDSLDEAEAMFAHFRADGFNAVYVWGTAFSFINRDRIADMALRYGMPTVADGPEFARVGVLLTYGWELSSLIEDAADYIDRLLRGTKPADLPLRQPTRFELTINLKTAKALGIDVPPSIMILATEVIE